MDLRGRRGDHQLTQAEPKPQLKTEHHHSAGGLVVRGGEILLISTQNGRRWQLPKGHLEAGETPLDAAVREVREETGVTGRIVAELPGVEYWYVEKGAARRIHKRVDYYLLLYVSGDSADYDPAEVSGASWFAWDEGIARISFDNERRVLERARRLAAEHAAERSPDSAADAAADLALDPAKAGPA